MKPALAIHNCPFCDVYLDVSDDDYKPLPVGAALDVVANSSHLPQADVRPESSDTGLLSTAETFTPFQALLKTEEECCL